MPKHIDKVAIMAVVLLIMGIAVFYVVDMVLGSDATQSDCGVGLPARLHEPRKTPAANPGDLS